MIIRLEVGKTYRNRNGKEVEVIKYEKRPPHDVHPFFGSNRTYPFFGSDDEWYAENGQFNVDIGDSPYDLIEEIKEEKMEQEQELKLEVGKTYRTKEGKEVEIILHQKQHSDDLHPFLGGNGRWYTNDGQLHLNDLLGDRYDLVEEIKEKKVEDSNKKQELKLEVGKTYRDREGKGVEIIAYRLLDDDDLFPFQGCNGIWYKENGQLNVDLVDSHYDLIEEINEEKVEDSNKKQELKLEVGKTYKARGGEEVTIVRRATGKDIEYPFEDTEGEGYTEDGQFYGWMESEHDLIEEIKTETEEKKMEKVEKDIQKQELKLKVGKTYRNREGKEVKIIEFRPHGSFPFMDEEDMDYKENGRFRFDIESRLDLVEEVSTETEEMRMEKVITPEEYLKQFKQITEKMYEITKAKNSDYTADSGDAFTNFKVVEDLNICSVETGFLTRMSDKIARLAGLAKGKEIQVKDEKYEDTLLDLANYSILLAIYLKNKSL